MTRSMPSGRGRSSGASPLTLTAEAFRHELAAFASPKQAAILQRFFKTAPGEYGHGDQFIGAMVPQIRSVVRRYRDMPPQEATLLVSSPIHEERLGGLLLWVQAFDRGAPDEQARIFRLYLRHTSYVNNWDLVDLSAPQIVGGSLSPHRCGLLSKMAKSHILWERRIAVLATLTFIRNGHYGPTLRLCRMLMDDEQDLMHKACGWMLREVGKRDRPTLCDFLDRNAARMPRTMLRYALEHFDAQQRLDYMSRRATRRLPEKPA